MEMILTVGPTCSGKTTWAEEFVRNRGDWVNINRDDIRFALNDAKTYSDYRFTKARERKVTDTAMTMFQQAVSEGLNVVISDTNLNEAVRRQWESLAEATGYKYSEKHFIQPLKELIKRNRHKGVRAVPEHVVKEQYTRYLATTGQLKTYVPNEELPRAVVFDIDGTLAQMVDRGPFEWHKVGSDVIKPNVVRYLTLLQQSGIAIVTLSGRDGVCEAETVQWLADNGIYPDGHFQRAEGDPRSDDIIKEEIFWNVVALGYNVLHMVDDRQQVVDMWRRIGLECWQVAAGDF